MQRQIITFREVIERWSTRAELARAIGVSPVTVRLWHHRDTIPTVYWKKIARFAKANGFPEVTTMVLASIMLGETKTTPPPEKTNGTET